MPWPETGPKSVGPLNLVRYCGPSVSKGRAVVFDRLGSTERLRCVKAETGEVLWEETSPTGYIDMFGYDGGPRSSPILCDGYVITYGEGLIGVPSAGSWESPVEDRDGKEFHVIPNFFGVGITGY